MPCSMCKDPRDAHAAPAGNMKAGELSTLSKESFGSAPLPSASTANWFPCNFCCNKKCAVQVQPRTHQQYARTKRTNRAHQPHDACETREGRRGRRSGQCVERVREQELHVRQACLLASIPRAPPSRLCLSSPSPRLQTRGAGQGKHRRAAHQARPTSRNIARLGP